MPSGVALYGGFAGNETSIGQRPAFPRSSPDGNETVLDGQSGGNVVTATSTNVSNTLNGFTIQHGSPNGVIASSVLSIYNCKIYSNVTGIRMTASAIISDSAITYNTSHGIYLQCWSGATVSGNKINHNTRRGIYCDQGQNYVINRNSIEYNNTGNTTYSGGGIYMDDFSGDTSYIVNNFIRGNGATSGGGIYCFESNLNIYNNTIVDNHCSVNGDGICIRNFYDNKLYICNNIVANNSGGYGMYIDNDGWNYVYSVYLSKNCTYQNGYGDRAISGWGATFSGTGDEQTFSPGLSTDRCHLTSSSSCINAGHYYAWNDSRYYGPYDIDGETRIVGFEIDIGCNEVQ